MTTEAHWISPNGVDHLILSSGCVTCGNPHDEREIAVYTGNLDQSGFDWHSTHAAIASEDDACQREARQ